MPAELAAYTLIWPLLVTPQVCCVDITFHINTRVLRTYLFFAKPCERLAESKYRPTTSPLSLIPVGSVPLEFEKLIGVSFAFAYSKRMSGPALALVHQPTATPALLIPKKAIPPRPQPTNRPHR